MPNRMSPSSLDQWLAIARKYGEGIARVLVAAYPPPWDHDWFVEFYRDVLEPQIDSYSRRADWSEAEETRCRDAVVAGFREGVEHLVHEWPTQRALK